MPANTPSDQPAAGQSDAERERWQILRNLIVGSTVMWFDEQGWRNLLARIDALIGSADSVG